MQAGHAEDTSFLRTDEQRVSRLPSMLCRCVFVSTFTFGLLDKHQRTESSLFLLLFKSRLSLLYKSRCSLYNNNIIIHRRIIEAMPFLAPATCYRKQQILVTRNWPLEADSGLAV